MNISLYYRGTTDVVSVGDLHDGVGDGPGERWGEGSRPAMAAARLTASHSKYIRVK